MTLSPDFLSAAKTLGLTEEQASGVLELLAHRPTMAMPLNMSVEAMLRELRGEIRAMTGKWLNRERAAAYLCTSEATIDKAAGMGKLTKRFLFGTPLYLREDLDSLVTNHRVKLPFVAKEKRQAA